MKLLIVDDSMIIRNRIARVLEDPRMSHIRVVGMAPNGVDAIELFKMHKPKLVTMDITMPEMDGVECTEQMVRLNPDCNILVVSALSDKATALKALIKGARGFIYKPFSDEQLINAFVELTNS
ncbi:response regulator [Betaproteobacteria bacterium]|nr:response regulator [Betaproteobacteria bacterium]GHT97557.1 response regulator [Betaproteobacteria bacterium]GHT97994.1 response regulator [Betaproteobacteria bacterium]GHU11858.1 response regulator [Betaproteobacteria bacterium]GHU18729.1 response regulator [Betaproteobacteria bacterium]